MEKGKFIVIEGIQGSGKSTALKGFKELFDVEKSNIHFTHEPGGSEPSNLIREQFFVSDLSRSLDPMTFFCLMWASRREHVVKTIIPKMEEGKHIISDRFHSSTYAIQIASDERYDMLDLFNRMTEEVVGSAVPDLYVYLKIDPKIAVERRMARNRESYFDVQKFDFYTRMDKGYEEFFKDKPHVVIDAHQAPEKVATDVYDAISKHITLEK